ILWFVCVLQSHLYKTTYRSGGLVLFQCAGIPCYSLLRSQKFPAPIFREFMCKVLKLHDEIASKTSKPPENWQIPCSFPCSQGIHGSQGINAAKGGGDARAPSRRHSQLPSKPLRQIRRPFRLDTRIEFTA